MLQNKRILAIGAHPDDIEIGCMGTLVKLLSAGNFVKIIVMTEGDYGNPRRKEQAEVFESLANHYENFSYHHFMYKDNDSFIDSYSSLKRDIETEITLNKIDAVFTHYHEDSHPHHRVLSQASADAARNISLFYYHSANSKDFQPNYFVNLDEKHMNVKSVCLKAHKTQNDRNNGYYFKKINAIGSFYGQMIHTDYAEAFVIGKYINE